jgi:energy-coupling factor transporter transmembrane protein EcfT
MSRSNRWAERTVAELAGVAREMAFQERWARPERGRLQRRDARAKLVAAFGLLVTVGLINHALPIVLAVSLLLAAAARTGVPPLLLFRRAAPLAFPLLVLVCLTAAFPALGGWSGALRIALRTTASLLITLLLVLTTRWTDLTRGLRGLGIPALFVAVLEQTRRHLVHLPLEAEEMFQARRARTVGAVAAGDGRRFVGHSMGALLGKTQAAADAAHAAMLARGYGYIPPERRGVRTGTGWTVADAALVLLSAALSATLIGMDHCLVF